MRTALVLFVAVFGFPLLAAAEIVVPVDSVKYFVNIRAEPDAESDVIGRLYKGDNKPLIQSIDGWHEVEIEPDLNGFISADWTRVIGAADLAEETVAAEETKSAKVI